MDPLDFVRLNPVMKRTSGRSEVVVALIDGPVLLEHPQLSNRNIRTVDTNGRSTCLRATSIACRHGTFVAGILSAKRGSGVPAICPGCTLLVRPIFLENAVGGSQIPNATPGQLADAIIEAVDAHAGVLNMSIGLVRASAKAELRLQGALDYAAKRGVIPVVAAGNQGTITSSVLTRHPWVIPVAACDLQGRPAIGSNLGSSISRRGLSAPGQNITSLETGENPQSIQGTSAAAPFVTGAIALLWSEFPAASADEIRFAVTRAGERRSTVVPPVLDAWTAYETLVPIHKKR
jgi:subtilisin family serine protease